VTCEPEFTASAPGCVPAPALRRKNRSSPRYAMRVPV